MAEVTTKGPGLTATELRALPAMVPAWPTAGQAFRLGRNATYQLIATGEFPVKVHKLGRAYRCVTADILAALGVEERAAS